MSKQGKAKAKKIRNLINRIKAENGHRAEDLVQQAFDSVGDPKTNGTFPSWLLKVEPSPPCSDRDDAGIDIRFITDVGPIDVQIKTSKLGMLTFEEKRRRLKRSPFIISILINTSDSIEVIRAHIMSKLKARYGEIATKRNRTRYVFWRHDEQMLEELFGDVKTT